jgi:hypothetical protein
VIRVIEALGWLVAFVVAILLIRANSGAPKVVEEEDVE